MPQDEQGNQERSISPREIKDLSVLVITPLLPFSLREVDELLDVLEIPKFSREIVSPDAAKRLLSNGLPYNLIIYSDKSQRVVEPNKNKSRKYLCLPYNQASPISYLRQELAKLLS